MMLTCALVKPRKVSMRSPSMMFEASVVFLSFEKDRHAPWQSPPTPLTTPDMRGGRRRSDNGRSGT